MSPLLDVSHLTVRHGQLQAITDVSLRVDAGSVVAVIGANGAGKSTLLGAIAGLLTPAGGSIVFDGESLLGQPAHRRVARGLSLVLEGRRLFPSLSLEDNLRTGAYLGRPGPWSLERIFELFPWMKDRRRQLATKLSGGEQQAVAIARGLLSNPRLLLLDEVSLGLAPVVVRKLYDLLPRILSEGTSLLLVEQDVSQALRAADYVVCLLEGRVSLEGPPVALSAAAIEAAYFGIHHTAGADERGSGERSERGPR
ncbi:MAG TPA: ABC transporter ATP-binding protein [Polyangiaceae bacterium]|jgi:branched-chain amino acid transport system ATP-binding protein